MKKLLYLGMALVLVLSVMAPATVFAAKPVANPAPMAVGTVTGITPGTVVPLGGNLWQVIERDVTGQFSSGSLKGPFTLTYSGIFEVPSQAGTMQGVMKAGNDGKKQFTFAGITQPLGFVQVAPGVYLPQLTIVGQWTQINGNDKDTDGRNGTFQAVVVFIPNEYGHVVSIVASSIIMLKSPPY